MTSLFNAEKTFVGNIVTLARPLTRDDVLIEDATTNHCGYLSKFITAGKHISLKQPLIDKLLESCGIKVDDKGLYLQKSGLVGLTDGWNSKRPSRYGAFLQQEVEYRGLRTEKTKFARLQSELDKLQVLADGQQEHMIDAAIAKMTADIESSISDHNAKVSQKIREVVVNLKVGSMDRVLNSQEQADLQAKQDEEAKLEAQIAALREQLKGKQMEAYQIKRQAVRREALKQLGEKGQAIVESMDDEKQEINELPFTF